MDPEGQPQQVLLEKQVVCTLGDTAEGGAEMLGDQLKPKSGGARGSECLKSTNETCMQADAFDASATKP